jgi:2-octaprenyl-6-methoxyphenol hydroxylase
MIKEQITTNTDYDIVIVGGGLVGASLAVALAPTTHRIALIEAQSFSASDQSYDERSLALGYGSRQIYSGIGLWDKISSDATPIENIHISERGHFGVTRLSAQQMRMVALGYVVTLRHLGQVLATAMQGQANLTVFTPAQVEGFQALDEGVAVDLMTDDGQQSISTRLLVAADGVNSPTRSKMNIAVREEDYGQHALIANVTPAKAHDNRAFERFTADGPVALLPLSQARCALVWTQTPETAADTLALSDKEFLNALEEHFGHRLGRFIKTGKREVYPLKLMLAERLTGLRSLLIGNAAHTLHPVAGQGLNLALRDVAVLAELLAKTSDPGEEALMQEYEQARSPDIAATARYTDGLLRLFTNPWLPLGHARSLSLALMDRVPSIKHRVARVGMGYRSQLRGPLFRGASL